jgi:diguanylate cyclase (GGDEF)-like protein/PAS domain S-box-containing protein
MVMPQFNGYVLALIISALIPAILGVIAFRRLSTTGSGELGWLLLSLAWWSLMAAFEGASRELGPKVFWTVLSYIGSQPTAVLFLLFVLRYTRQVDLMRGPYKAVLFLIPSLSLLMAASNSVHHLLWPTLDLVQTDWIGVVLIYGHGPWFWVEIAYAYVLIVISLILLARAIFRFPHVFSLHSRILFLVALVPWIFSILYAFGEGRTRQVDLTPLGFSWAGVLLTWSMLRYGFLQLVPVSREQIIDSLSEGVLLVDARRRVIEANHAMRAIFAFPPRARGQPLWMYLAAWPEVLAFLAEPGEARKEICLPGAAEACYEFHRIALSEAEGRSLGWVLTVKDISKRKQAEQALRESERRYRHLIENQGEGIWIVDPEERISFANPAAEQIFGVASGGLAGRKLDELIRPDQLAVVRPQDGRRQSSEKSTVELEIEGPQGARRVIELTTTPQFTAQGAFLACFGIIREITARKLAEEATRARTHYLATLNEITRAALEASDLPEMLQTLADQMGSLLHADGCFITLWNEETGETIPTAAYGAMRATYPKTPCVPGERTMTQSVLEAGHALVAEDVSNSPYMSPHIARGFPTRSILGLPLIAGGRKLGAALIAFNHTHPFRADEVSLGEQAAAQISLAVLKNRLLDEAQQARSQAEATAGQLQQALVTLDELANKDSLTGAYNRLKFDEMIRSELGRLERYGTPLSLAMLDIDHFKMVNDTYGHATGDHVLAEVVRTIQENVRETDGFFRWGGEEFLLLSPGINLEQSVAMAWKIQQIIAAHVFFKVNTLTVSLGVTQARSGDSIDDLLLRADLALYEAKRNGRNRVNFVEAK